MSHAKPAECRCTSNSTCRACCERAKPGHWTPTTIREQFNSGVREAFLTLLKGEA